VHTLKPKKLFFKPLVFTSPGLTQKDWPFCTAVLCLLCWAGPWRKIKYMWVICIWHFVWIYTSPCIWWNDNIIFIPIIRHLKSTTAENQTWWQIGKTHVRSISHKRIVRSQSRHTSGDQYRHKAWAVVRGPTTLDTSNWTKLRAPHDATLELCHGPRPAMLLGASP